MTEKEQKQAAKEFAEFWKDKGYEKGQSQTFWLQLLSQVYDVERPEKYIEFQYKNYMELPAQIEIAPDLKEHLKF